MGEDKVPMHKNSKLFIQILCPQEDGQNIPLLNVSVHSDFLPKNTVWKKREKK